MPVHAADVQAHELSLWYRWRCSCGEVGPWRVASKLGGAVKAVRSARRGGQRHVAAMERGR
jgi:hypothetical protein